MNNLAILEAIKELNIRGFYVEEIASGRIVIQSQKIGIAIPIKNEDSKIDIHVRTKEGGIMLAPEVFNALNQLLKMAGCWEV